MQVGGRLHAANSLSTTPLRAGVVGHVLTPSATHLGRLTVASRGHVGRVAGGGFGIARVGGASSWAPRTPVLTGLFTLGGFVTLLPLAQAVASRPELIEWIMSFCRNNCLR